jgi:AraC-like DNA-binding protein
VHALNEHIGSACFKCLLFFFSSNSISDFLLKYRPLTKINANGNSKENDFYFQIEKDTFIIQFIASLQQIFSLKEPLYQNILNLKLEEILLYLIEKYQQPFVAYLNSLLKDEKIISFKSTIEKNVCSNLSLEEIAFLCNMSVSTFKRKFIETYQVSPGKWFQTQRLNKAKELMIEKKLRASEIYLDFGYNNLSSFSFAFKNEFGYSPKEVINF